MGYGLQREIVDCNQALKPTSSMLEQVNEEVVRLELELGRKKKLAKLLSENPVIEEVFSLMRGY